MEISPLFGEAVDIGSLHIRMPVTAQITPAPVIGEDEENVGLGWILSREQGARNLKKENAGKKFHGFGRSKMIHPPSEDYSTKN